jgi:hypothetical protein
MDTEKLRALITGATTLLHNQQSKELSNLAETMYLVKVRFQPSLLQYCYLYDSYIQTGQAVLVPSGSSYGVGEVKSCVPITHASKKDVLRITKYVVMPLPAAPADSKAGYVVPAAVLKNLKLLVEAKGAETTVKRLMQSLPEDHPLRQFQSREAAPAAPETVVSSAAEAAETQLVNGDRQTLWAMVPYAGSHVTVYPHRQMLDPQTVKALLAYDWECRLELLPPRLIRALLLETRQVDLASQLGVGDVYISLVGAWKCQNVTVPGSMLKRAQLLLVNSALCLQGTHPASEIDSVINSLLLLCLHGSIYMNIAQEAQKWNDIFNA